MSKTQSDSPTPAQEPPIAVWRAGFLAALSLNGNVSAAARAVGITRGHCYWYRDKDPGFAQEWEEALTIAVERLEEKAWQRAAFDSIQYKFTKTGEPLYFPEGHALAGQPYFEHVGSDTVLLRLLEAHKPDTYKRRSEVTGKDGAPLVPPPNIESLTREDLLSILTLRRKLEGKEGLADGGN